MTITPIRIEPAPESLAQYLHASLSSQAAKSLAAEIETLQGQGIRVISANGARRTVPKSYRSAYKMHAPHWIFVNGAIIAVDAKLENRSGGVAIPANFTVAGSVPTPEGFRCSSRDEESTVFRSA